MLNTSIKLKPYIILLDTMDYKNIIIIKDDNSELQELLDSWDYVIVSDTSGNIDELNNYVEDIEDLIAIHNKLYNMWLRWHELFNKIKRMDNSFEDDYYILYDVNKREIIYAPTYTQFLEYEDSIWLDILFVDSHIITEDTLNEQNLLDIANIMSWNYSTWSDDYESVKKSLKRINPEKYNSNWTDKFTLY